MNCTLAMALATFVLAPAGARGDTFRAFPPAQIEVLSESLSAARHAKRFDRATVRAQLTSDVPAARQQAAAVSRDIAARALTELKALVTQPSRLRVEQPVANIQRPDTPSSRSSAEAPAEPESSNPYARCSQRL